MKTLDEVELRDNISKVLSEVEGGETVDVARNGRIVAQLVPARRHRPTQRDIDEAIEDMAKVAADLGSRWPKGVSVLDAIDDVRS